MKTIILAIILAVSLCTTAYILNRNFHGNVLIRRIAKAETKIAVLQDRFTRDQHHARWVVDEVKKIVIQGYAPYEFIIPINRGFLGIISSRYKQKDDTRKGQASANQNP